MKQNISDKKTRKTRFKLRWKILLTFFVLFIVASYVFNNYISDFYHATGDAKKALIPDNEVTVETLPDSDKTIVFRPAEIKSAIIFYPGGKVEYKAYAPLLHELAAQGYLCILLHMTNNLAIFESDAAETLNFKALYPEVKSWYIAGHSLGGAMAASYISKNSDQYDGLILLAAYSTKDLSNTDLNVISIYGSEDKVLNFKKYQKSIRNLPKDYKEYVIDGGCHSYFGMYGLQGKDGQPGISNEEQIQTTVDFIRQSIK